MLKYFSQENIKIKAIEAPEQADKGGIRQVHVVP